MDVLIAYLEEQPLVALVLLVLGAAVLWAVIKQVAKLAFILLIVLAVGVYWTNEEAQADWQAKGRTLLEKAGNSAGELLKRAGDAAELLKKGQEALDQ
jgi:hypothetical protein